MSRRYFSTMLFALLGWLLSLALAAAEATPSLRSEAE